MALPARPLLSKRVVALVIACALLALIWFNAASKGQFGKTFGHLSKQAKQAAASNLSVLTGKEKPHSLITPLAKIAGEEPDVDTQPQNVTDPPTSISDKQPNVDAQRHNITTPPTTLFDEEPDVDAQPHNITTPPTTLFDEEPDVDAQLYNVTALSTNVSSLAPFPPLPPPDDDEYIAICMAG